MAALLVTAVGSFQSCKDYDDDINAVEANVQKLQDQQVKLEAALTQAQNELKVAQSEADAAIKAAAKDATDASAAAKAANDAIEALGKVAAKQSEVDVIQGVLKELKEAKATDEAAIAAIAGRIDAIDGTLNVLTNGLSEIAGIQGDLNEAIEAIAALKADMQQQVSALNIFKESVDSQLASIVKAMEGAENIENLGDLLSNLATKLANAETNITALQGRIAQIDTNTTAISDLRTQITELQPAITNAVTSVQNVQTTVNTLNVFVDNCLTSLVLRPTLYYGGIEAIEAIHAEYQPLGFSIYYIEDHQDTNGNMVGGSNVAYDRTTGNGYQIAYEYNAKDSLVYKYPMMDAYYHVNPKNISNADIQSLELNTADKHYVNTGNTRADRTSLDWGLDLVGADKFSVENGILHTWLKNTADIWHRVEQYAHTVTVVSLEANAYASDGTTRKVTSDWAAIARVHQNNFRIADNDAYILHYSEYPYINYPQDTYCAMMDVQQREWTESHSYTAESQKDATKYNRDPIHVYRQAKQAIDSPYTHLLQWNGSVDLDKVIEVHADHHYFNAEDQVLDADATDRIYDFPVDLEKLGFVRKYTVVNYEYPIDGMDRNYNGTQESQHAHLEADGHTLTANFVVNGKRDVNSQSRASVGREPLVMIEILDMRDQMTWNPDHMRWCKDSVNNDPKPNLVAVGFVKFKIVDEVAPVVLGTIDVMSDAMYASCDGDTVLANWYQVEEQILAKLADQGIEKSTFEAEYTLRGENGEDLTLRELALLNPTGRPYFRGQIYVPQTNKNQIYGTRKNWVDGAANLNNPACWVLPDVVLNHDITETGFVDRNRYGRIVYTNYDWQHRETNLIGVAFTAEEMLQQLVKRDHRGHYLDSLGNKVDMLCDADFYPSVQTKVAAKLVAPNHNGYPEVTIVFDLTVYLNKATMNRPAMKNSNGNWYGANLDYINANIDAHNNGTYAHDVRRFVANLQQALDGQKWMASTTNFDGTENQHRAFEFKFDEIKDQPNGLPAKARAAVQRFKLNDLHGDLYFYTNNWLGDLEEGTPYWHDWKGTEDPKDDAFYADRYILKVCYTNDPTDTVVWAQEGAPGNNHIGKLGKYLFAYPYIQDYTRTPSTIVTTGIANTSYYDMTKGQLIAWIDNIDTHLFDLGTAAAINKDANGRFNENVNVHYNYNSSYAKDLLNRAGRYAEKGNQQDGYSNANDNPFTAYVHLNLFEGDCIEAINPDATEDQSNYVTRGNHSTGTMQYVSTHRPMGVPVMLCNPDFKIRFLRPLNVEMKNPWAQGYETGVTDAVEKNYTATIKYKDLFRRDSKKYPQDWRGLNYFNNKDCVGFIQGYNDCADNLWNTATPQWNYSQLRDRSDKFQHWFMPVVTPEDYEDWTADNVVPNIDHMLTNYGGTENYYELRASQISMKIEHFTNANGNVESTKFTYLNDDQNRGDFDIIIPVTVKYAWGDITTTGRWAATVTQSWEQPQPNPSPVYPDYSTRLHNDNMLFVKVHFTHTVGNN